MDCVQRTLGSPLRSVQNGARAVLRADYGAGLGRARLVDLFGGGVCVRPRGAELGVHVGKLALDELVVGDRGAELFPGVCVWKDEVQRGLHDSVQISVSVEIDEMDIHVRNELHTPGVQRLGRVAQGRVLP